MKTELKVGIFAIIVIVLLSYMTFKISGLGVAWKKGYKLHVVFDNISGLDEKSRVKIAGVNAGVVGKVWLEEGKAKLTLLINPDVVIYEDAKASLRVSGLLGDKYLSVWAGTPSKQPLKEGGWIKNTESAADIDALANQLSSAASHISSLAEAFEEILGKSEKEAIRETLQNLKTLTKNFNEILAENREPLHNTLVRLEDFSRTLNDKGPGLIDDLSKAARGLREVIEDNRYAFNESVENIRGFSQSAENITQKIEKGEGTLGKLVHDDKLYDSFSKVSEGAGKSFDVVERLRTYMDFRTEYFTKDSEWKGYFDLTIQPRDDIYYILGVVSDPIGSSEFTRTIIDGVEERKEEIKREIEYSAQFAKRFEDFILRVGMLESTFGFGVDYLFHDDKGKISFNMWDFGDDEADADNAHIKVGLDYKIFKYLFISSGIDNLLNSNRRGIYVGGGLKFEDRDFKYILGLIP